MKLPLSNLSTVYVVDDTGAETSGRLVHVSAHSLTVAAGGIERQFEATHVRRIDRRGDSVRNGALIGAIAGAVMGLAGAGLSDCPGRHPGGHCPGERAALVAVSTGAYAAAGTVIDACHVGRTTVYVADVRGAHARRGTNLEHGAHEPAMGLKFTW
jgi:hypothetical protein